MIIAVDGPSAAGKGTIAHAVATELGYHFLDTGTLYRMVGLAMLRSGSDLGDADRAANVAASLDPAQFTGAELRGERVAAAASRVSALPAVRDKLLAFQREFAARKPGAVLDGRDIGTVVCPEADIKIYVTAAADVRARRRYEELRETDTAITFESVLADVRTRDERDTNRDVSPLLPARDAVIFDTSEMTRDEAVAAVLQHIKLRRG